jgi:hypothetical protein
VKVKVEVEGLEETLRAFNRYGKDANRELRQAAGVEVDRMIAALIVAGEGAGSQAALTAGSVKRRSDRVPVIVAGGTRRLKRTSSKGKATAGDVFFGAEFGGGRRPSTRQFPPWVGRRGYWFWPTIRRHLPDLRRRYIAALDELAAKWAAGGNLPD